MRRLLKKYVFALLVVMALACAIYFARSTAVPEPVPDYALQAAEIYRLEIGVAFFVAFYLATLAFLLAISGRGFAEFGTKGLKIEKVIEQKDGSSRRQAQIDRQTREMLKGIQSTLASHQKRLERMEEGR